MHSSRIPRFFALLTGAVLVAVSLLALWDHHTSGIAAQAPPSCIAPASGLVSWWPGDGNTVDIQDSNPGTLVNGATFAPGKVGLGFSLDGVDDRVEIPDAANLKPANVTVDAWVKFDALDTPGASLPGLQYIVFKRNSRTSFFEGYTLVKIRVGAVDRLRFVISSAAGVQVVASSTTAVAAGQFYHVAGSYDGSSAKLYVNGALEDQQAASFPLDYGTRPVFIGTSEEGHNGRLKGVVDEVSIYNRALSAAEIQAIFNAGSAGKCKPSCVAPPSGLAGWWPGDGQVVDIQGNNNGTLQGNTTFTTGKVGQGFKFDPTDGSADYVSIPDSPSHKPANISVEAWVKFDALDTPGAFFTGGQYIVFKKNSRPFDFFEGYTLVKFRDASGDRISFGIASAGGVQKFAASPPTIVAGQFYHVVGTYDFNGTSGTVKLYLNGVLGGSISADFPIDYGTRPLFIGGHPEGGTANLQGVVDEVSIYNRALSASEIQALYNAGSAGKCKPSGVQLDSRATFLHTSSNDIPVPPAIVNLAAAGFAPGDLLKLSFTLQNFSFFSCSGPFATPAQVGVNAVFSNSDTLFSPNVLARVPGAIDAGPDYISTPTAFGNEPTDIPQDFILSGTVQVPAGATYLFLGVVDSYYQDNCGKVIVTMERVAADLEVTQSVSPDPVVTGSDLTYQIVVKNNGPSTAASVLMADNLPASAAFVSCTATGGGLCGGSGNYRTVTFPSLASGASATVTLVTKVNCSVADDAMIGNTATVSSTTPDSNSSNNSTTVTVTASNPKPSITAPPALTINADVTACGKVVDDVTLGTVTVTDNCPGVTITRSGVPAGNFFPASTTTIIYTVTDAGGNTATATQTVTVIDNTAPTITPPPAVMVATGPGSATCGAVVNDATLGAATATDNCGTAGITRSGVPAGHVFPVGTTTITYTADDGHGNIATATQTVIVTDTTPPTITAPPTVNATTGAGATACSVVISDATLGNATASDYCTVTVTRSGVPAGNVFPVGTTFITYTATDGSGNTATATQQVIVTDDTPPTITAPPAVNASTVAGATSCGTVVGDAALGVAMASDNCGSATVTRSGVPAGNLFPVGTTVVTYTADDGHGNTATATQAVTVIDNTPPAITACATAQSVFADASCQAAVPDFTGGVTASDNCGAVTVTQSPAAGTPVGTGATSITLTVKDAAGNNSTCATSFTVIDNTPPSITAPSNVSAYTGAAATTCGVVISESALGAATASDACSAVTITRSGVPAGNFFNVGTTTITYIARDASGNTATATQQVTVIDNTPPVIACPANTSVAGNIAGSCAAAVNPGTVTATDNCAGMSVAGVRSDGQPLNASYPLGTTTITWKATDMAGNQSTCQQTVTVTNPAPVATITGPATGALYAVNTPVSLTGGFTDNPGGTHTATWTFDTFTQAGLVNETTQAVSATYSFTTPGVYRIKLTVADGCGGESTTDQVDGLTAIIVIYDPNGGWVSGGGWINSPAGAYAANPSLTGKANFAFQSKYQTGAGSPDGKTEFQFKVANLDFSSTSYEWLVVAGKKAQYKGLGTINGAGNYRFMLTAIDGDLPGGNGQDKFRIRIWSDGGGLVYDNQLNAPESDDPTTVLGGGSIVIHH